jgi:hypothetical protein
MEESFTMLQAFFTLTEDVFYARFYPPFHAG